MTQRSMWNIFTQAVHAGERSPRPDFIPTILPLHNSVTYFYDSMEDMDAIFAGEREGYVYGRYGNPTVSALERAISALEGGEDAVAFSSGMAAIHTALLAAGVRAGSTIVAARDLYGATYALLERLLDELRIRTRFVDVTDLAALEGAIEAERPAAVLKIADIPAIAAIAHKNRAALLLDHTFATPYLCRPLEMGADYVIHSATKYLSGHGDVLAGVVVSSRDNCQRMRDIVKLIGPNLGPNEAWLVMRGLKTFGAQRSLARHAWAEDVSPAYAPALRQCHERRALAGKQVRR